MSRSNYDKPFYVDVGTSIVAVRCASNHDVVCRRDHGIHPSAIKLMEDACDRMNREAEQFYEPNGNAAAMRDALKNLVDVIDRYASSSPMWWHNGAKGVIPLKNAKAALAAPPRNCDIGTAGEQHRRFVEYCNACDCPMGCIHRKQFIGILDTRCASMLKCYIRWSQMPYEAYEEGGK